MGKKKQKAKSEKDEKSEKKQKKKKQIKAEKGKTAEKSKKGHEEAVAEKKKPVKKLVEKSVKNSVEDLVNNSIENSDIKVKVPEMQPEEVLGISQSAKPITNKLKTQGRQKNHHVSSDEELTLLFKALGDENRIQIIRLLHEKELCAGELLSALSIVQSTLSHHMKILTESGIVGVRRDGKWSRYSIKADAATKMTAFLEEWFENY